MAGATKRWMRRELPWRPTIRGVVVAGPNGALELRGAAGVIWEQLQAPASRGELAAIFTDPGPLTELQGDDPLALLSDHDLIVEVS